jgi:HEAT repeat protein
VLAEVGEAIRKAAAESLSRLGEPQWKDWVRGDNEDWERLAHASDPRAVDVLAGAFANMLRPPSDIFEKCALERSLPKVVEALTSAGGSRAAEAIIPALGHPDCALSMKAAKALGALGERCAVQPLIGMLRRNSALDYSDFVFFVNLPRSNPDCFHSAADALVALGDVRAVEPFISALQSGFARVRGDAARALGSLGDLRATEPLISALADKEPSVRESAAAALSKLGQPEWAQWVHGEEGDWARLAESEHPRVRELFGIALGPNPRSGNISVAMALGELQDERAVEPLIIGALSAGDAGVRVTAVQSLSRLGHTAWAQWIKGDNDDWMRVAKSGHPSAIELLRIAFGSKIHTVSVNAAVALGALGDNGVVSTLVKQLEGSSLDGRRRAAAALIDLADVNPKLLLTQWRAIREAITRPHHDGHDDRWQEVGWVDDHVRGQERVDTHSDWGIGWDFPKRPPHGLGGEATDF